ncbi:MAG: hypothetical protein OJF55_000251 [Rhodanobacteraceae bacterium]|jgi:uncharacterized membrane-anchored protein YhcB (DUF1043 family)|nr:MAG: hypothetical protein OJF55_000251 [Rhodanobacteraceae bacterium]
MQAILIMLPILVYALLAGIVLGYVLAVLMPRLRRTSAGRQREAVARRSHHTSP